MNDLPPPLTAAMGHVWATVSPRTAAVLRERRVQIALEPASGRHRITIL